MVTGAAGFIGSAVLRRLQSEPSMIPKAVVRSLDGLCLPVADVSAIGDISGVTDWKDLLSGVSTIIHSAALAHVNNHKKDSSVLFRRVNVEGAINLARQAAEAGVERFIFLSSIGVNGDSTIEPFNESDKPCPSRMYAVSKLEAEEGLWEVQKQTGIEIVIVRPPLVYGKNAPGNFGMLVKALAKGVPLPLGSVGNKRSFIGVDNLVDFLAVCIDHPAAANQVFLVSDGDDLSTTDFLKLTAKGLGRSARLIPVPSSLLRIALTLLGRREMATSLLDSLRIDISKAQELLGWIPPVSVEEGLRRAVAPLTVGRQPSG